MENSLTMVSVEYQVIISQYEASSCTSTPRVIDGSFTCGFAISVYIRRSYVITGSVKVRTLRTSIITRIAHVSEYPEIGTSRYGLVSQEMFPRLASQIRRNGITL